MNTATIAGTEKTVYCRPVCKKISGSIDLNLLNQFFASAEGGPNPSILGGNPAKEKADGFSYWAAKPVEVFRFGSDEKHPFEKLHRVLNKYQLEGQAVGDLPDGIFVGGWIGFFGYELGRFIEPACGGPEKVIDNLHLPLIRLCFYDRFIAYDHIRKDCWLIALQLERDSEDIGEKIAGLERDLNRSQELTVKEPQKAQFGEPDFLGSAPSTSSGQAGSPQAGIGCNMDKDHYLRAVERIKRYIYDGDVYQVNFSQRFESDYRQSPVEFFHWQNRFNPCGYSAYIDGGDFAIVSASPEMFLTIKDGVISTKPIKGTRPRVGDEGSGKQINARNFNELVCSPKEQAELNMIIDLERNDLARVCQAGTRKVVQPRTIEVYPTVYHAVATVEGRLRKDVNFCDCLCATFPGGSITGAPKVSAMKIINELEPTQRGIYTGGIGFIGLDGGVCLNIAIRTVIIKGKKAFVQTGGGIVADSEPEAEWNETLTKARVLMTGIQSVVRRAY